MIITIDHLIAEHWNGCDVLSGETPEAYASRREQEQLVVCVLIGTVCCVIFPDDTIEILRREGGDQ